MNIIAVRSSSGKHNDDSSVSPLKAAHAMGNLLVEVEVLDFEGEFMHKKHNPSRMIKSPADTQQLFRRGANLTVLLTPPLDTSSALDENVPLLLIPPTVAVASAEKGTKKPARRSALSSPADDRSISVGVSSIDFCPINNGTTIKLLVRVRELFTPAGVPMMEGGPVSSSRDAVLKQLLGSKLTVEFGKMESMRMVSSTKAGLPHLKVAVGNSICIRQPSVCNPVFS